MHGFWSEKNWRLDHDALTLPSGQRITLQTIRQWQADRVAGQYDLTGKWPGWRVRQQWLIAPGGTIKRGRIAQRVLRQLMQFSDQDQRDISRRQLPLF
ncbi:MAG TPA: hypothetical protein VGN24_00220 [Rhodanobacter sp.]|jgi:hypothetical protein|nr:hypothetical protein [Rhodanobacter sp.]